MELGPSEDTRQTKEERYDVELSFDPVTIPSGTKGRGSLV